jgi:hypothetical protein
MTFDTKAARELANCGIPDCTWDSRLLNACTEIDRLTAENAALRERGALPARMVELARETIRARDEVGPEFDSVPDYACGRPSPIELEFAELVLTTAERSEQDALFIRGAQACRELMARFVEGQGNATLAMSLRANWNPSWGTDPGRVDSASGSTEQPRLTVHEEAGLDGSVGFDQRGPIGETSNGEARAHDGETRLLAESTRRSLQRLASNEAKREIEQLTAERDAAIKERDEARALAGIPGWSNDVRLAANFAQERDAAIARAEAAEREVERLLAEMLAAQWKRGDIERETAEAIAAWLDSVPLLPSDSPRLELERAAWGEAFAADIRAGAWRKEPK